MENSGTRLINYSRNDTCTYYIVYRGNNINSDGGGRSVDVRGVSRRKSVYTVSIARFISV